MNKLMGMGTDDSAAKKEEIRNIFNSKVKDGESYITIAGMNMVTTKKLFKEIRTFYNYIVGYKDGDDPEIVIIEVSHDLESVGEPVYYKKSECAKAEYTATNGLFSISLPLSEVVSFGIIPSTALYGGYIIKVSYVDEMMPFLEFFQKRFEK
ncbi:MAG: hypothetical protein LBT56_04240 [Prevotellaceae bacterium]|nr:hypothetical protein [Prevotellaceae bacterium]